MKSNPIHSHIQVQRHRSKYTQTQTQKSFLIRSQSSRIRQIEELQWERLTPIIQGSKIVHRSIFKYFSSFTLSSFSKCFLKNSSNRRRSSNTNASRRLLVWKIAPPINFSVFTMYTDKKMRELKLGNMSKALIEPLNNSFK